MKTSDELKNELFNLLKKGGSGHYQDLAKNVGLTDTQRVYSILYNDPRIERVPGVAATFRIIPDKKEPAEIVQHGKPRTQSQQILDDIWKKEHIPKPIIKKTITEYRCPHCNGLLENSGREKQ